MLKTQSKIFLGIIISLFIAIVAIVLVEKPFSPPTPEITKLQSTEVKEYKGEKLSPISSVADLGIKGTQNIDVKNYDLEIAGLVGKPKKLAYDEVLSNQHYSKVVEINCVEGWSAKILWEGVLVKDLVDSAGPDSKANTVIFTAADGYTTSLPLDYIRDNNILLAYKMNGVVLPSEKGFPFQLVAEQKWGYKWIKWVTKIELSDNPDYRGYWESNGYNHNGDLTGPKMENK
jgi:DMSO/TMAO reductase YedYZ molybdopterin-dependent catalytic subunit